MIIETLSTRPGIPARLATAVFVMLLCQSVAARAEGVQASKLAHQAGHSRDAVTVVQSALVAKGCYNGKIDGVWDNDTRLAVARAAQAFTLRLDVRRPSDELIAALVTASGHCGQTIVASRTNVAPSTVTVVNKPKKQYAKLRRIKRVKRTRIGKSRKTNKRRLAARRSARRWCPRRKRFF